MTEFHGTDELVREYVRDTGGHFFSPDTMKFFSCRLVEVINLERGALVIMRQLKNGFVSRTEKIYRVAWYQPGTEHRCGSCHQRDELGKVDYLPLGVDDHDFPTLKAARQFAWIFREEVRTESSVEA